MLRVIGDVHGNFAEYRRIIKTAEQTFQVGDMGFEYYPIMTIDSNSHKFIGGNHEDYSVIDKIPSYLGDSGIWYTNVGEVFYMRGAWSIDIKQREKYQSITGQKVHWEEEELSSEKLEEAVQFYKENKPDLVITHACPQSIQKEFSKSDEFAAKFGHPSGDLYSRTGLALQEMYEFHQPKLWIFGHYHTFKELGGDKTHFVCLNMIPYDHWYVDVEKTDDGWNVILPDVKDYKEEYLRIWRENLYYLLNEAEARKAMKFIYQKMFSLRSECKFEICDDILRAIDVAEIPTTIMIAFLTITAAMKNRLKARSDFFNRSKQAMTILLGEEATAKNLEGLE